MSRIQPEAQNADTTTTEHTPKGHGGVSLGLVIGVGLLVVIGVAFLAATIGLGVAYRRKTDELAAARPACSTSQPTPTVSMPTKPAKVWNPFTQDELTEIGSFVRRNLNLQEEEETLASDWLFAIDSYPDDKQTILNHLDGTASYAGRYARAVVYHLSSALNPRVVEYKVGPIASFPIANNVVVTAIAQPGTLAGNPNIPANMRPVSAKEYELFEPLIADALAGPLLNLTLTSYNESYADGNLYWTDSAPRGYQRDTRQSWVWLLWYAEGMYALPVGLELLIDHKSLNSSDWAIIQLSYNSQGPWNSPEALGAAFNAGNVAVATYFRPRPTSDAPLFSSLRRRGAIRNGADKPAPSIIAQGGARYVLDGNQVQWMNWDFHIGYELVTGFNFHDIRFRGERIVYELALQDAYAAYSGSTAIQSLSQYSDHGWFAGSKGFELMPGVDCPLFAKYIDQVYFQDGKAKVNKRALCVWEQPEGMAVLRHYDQHFSGDGFTFRAGYLKTALVVRTTAAVFNYDYYYSYIFHLDGTIEVAAGASGYLQAAFVPSTAALKAKDALFAMTVHNFTQGNLHDHMWGFKIDLDILGTSNRLKKSEVKVGTFDLPWNYGGSNRVMKYVEKTDVTREGIDLSTMNVRPETPTSFHFHNHAAASNAWGNMRSYTVQIPSTIHQMLDARAPWMPAEQWTKYNLAVTVRKDSESHSCRVLYDMQAPAEPLLNFDSYLMNNESLVDQDLVVWLMMGGMHLPHSEDVPVTPTTMNTVRFFIAPVNYFDENPAIDSSNGFYETGPQVYPEVAEVSAVKDSVNVPLKDRCFDGAEL